MKENNPIPIVAELLTEKQAAAFLGISPRKLWSLRAAGEIKYVRCGRCIRYHIDDLRMWIEENKEGGEVK
jgi:excisionase family DNA binding protein